MITFQKSTLLRFYDDKEDSEFMSLQRGAHVAAITGVIGEELLLRLFFHFLQHRKNPVQCALLDGRPKRTGKSTDGSRGKGNWLDAWIQLGNDRLAQVEIKNWSAHSLGEKSLAIDASEAELAKISMERWQRFFGENNEKLPKTTEKIKLEYVPPAKVVFNGSIERVLCFWLPLAFEVLQPMTTATIDGIVINVFSASIYLRQLPSETLQLNCPGMETRINLLNALQGLPFVPRID